MSPAAANTVLTPESLKLATVYAEAVAELFPAEDELAEARRVAQELAEIGNLILKTDGAGELLDGVTLDADDRQTIVQRIFGGRVCETTECLLGVLCRNRRLSLIGAIGRDLTEQLDHRRGCMKVQVTTAVALDERQQRALADRLRTSLKIEPLLVLKVDPELIGGMKVRVGDTVYDASVAGELQQLTDHLSGADLGFDELGLMDASSPESTTDRQEDSE